MTTLFLILWGIGWTLLFSVGTLVFHMDLLVINVPVAMAAYCASRRRPFTAYFVTWVVGWVAALYSGGGRGPVLLSLLAICVLLVFTRKRLQTHSNWRLAGVVVAACVLWSLLFCLTMGMIGAGSWWAPFFQLSPLSAALTGIFALANNWALSHFAPSDYVIGEAGAPLRSL